MTCRGVLADVLQMARPPLAVPRGDVWVLSCHGDVNTAADWKILSGLDSCYLPKGSGQPCEAFF